MKRPNGYVVEEYITSSVHIFRDGKLIGHEHDYSSGEYTGRFCFQHEPYPTGKVTKMYTEKTAPKWLFALYYEATHD